MKLIDADLLETDGWRMERIRRYDQYCMEWQTKKPTEFDEDWFCADGERKDDEGS